MQSHKMEIIQKLPWFDAKWSCVIVLPGTGICHKLGFPEILYVSKREFS